MRITAVCEIIVTGKKLGEQWSPESWAANLEDCYLDGIGFPPGVEIKVKTLSLKLDTGVKLCSD